MVVVGGSLVAELLPPNSLGTFLSQKRHQFPDVFATNRRLVASLHELGKVDHGVFAKPEPNVIHDHEQNTLSNEESLIIHDQIVSWFDIFKRF